MPRFVLIATALLGLPCSATGLETTPLPALADLHLNPAPRSAAETARIKAVLAPPTQFDTPHRFEAMPAGAATVPRTPGDAAFSQPSANLAHDAKMTFHLGDAMFAKLWVSSPSSTLASDGLGPLYNARSCQRCHVNDGRGHAPEGPEDDATSMLLRLSVPAAQDDALPPIPGFHGDQPHPVYGGQLQDLGTPGQAGEYRLEVTYTEQSVTLPDGEVVQLRRPDYGLADLRYGPLGPEAKISARVAPQMIGLGLLEAIPAADILALADPQDADGDGISGRPNIVWSTEFNQPMLGRFGLKAGMPSLRAQVADAFSGDIGISSPLRPAPWGDCTAAQAACRDAPHGDKDVRSFEIAADAMDLVVFYSRNLGVPARPDAGDPQVLRGKAVFHAAGCAACHRPSFVTHRLPDQPAQSFQLIWPYTDLLLHDMGPGLADNRPEARATGREWRTPPLWGIGLTWKVSGHSQFLHDGRARSILEAILWHGGEAERARDRVARLPTEDRNALIAFLESL
ncbi:di-heme oxidoredictase family protein [Dinoroseobacter sp. S124A]|uniref:di-heme oxidoreductase family protein n=1 Tax=Dinoroseobacter sp. S124A TaxID=3415128 RepID=UPI003C7DB54D